MSSSKEVFASVRESLDRLGWIDDGEANYLVEQSGRFEFLLDYLAASTQPGQVLLEVGSHALHFAMAARSLGLEVRGTDVEFFAHHPVVLKRQAHFGIGDIRVYDLTNARLPFDDASCDVLNFAESIEHLNFNPLPAMREFYRVLKPGGRLIVTTPNAVRLGSRLKFLMGRNVFADLETLCKGDVYSVHFREYTMPELCRLVEWAGFTVAERHTRYLYKSVGLNKLAKTVVGTVAPQLAGNLIVIGRK